MGIETFAIFTIVLFAATYQAYKIGLREGSEKTIDTLHANKVIRFDHLGNIRPNPFFDA
tara:strand:+ start:319 stop:495 length:177 start_codon:yes stop_codon:yes gene_type:complete